MHGSYLVTVFAGQGRLQMSDGLLAAFVVGLAVVVADGPAVRPGPSSSGSPR